MAYEFDSEKEQAREKTQGELSSQSKHDVTIISRRSVSLDGLEDIVSFDDTCIVLRTALGLLSIDGEELHIVNMNVGSGELCVSGRICALFYEDGVGRKKGLFGKK